MSAGREMRRCHACVAPALLGGFTLTELLIALALSCLLLVGVSNIVLSSTRTQRTRDAVAELRERARYAIATLEPDIQMAGYYGLSARGEDFRWLQGGDAANAVPSALLQQTSPPLAAAPASAHECGSNFVLDLSVPVQADNNRYVLGRNRSAACAPNGGARPGSDTLTIRRAATSIATPTSGRFQLLVDRSDERRCWIVADGVAPPGLTPAPDLLEWHDLQLNSYYIANDSVGAPGTPALRVKSLTRVSGRPAFIDTEVMPGVEDLQVQFQTEHGVLNPDAVALNASVRLAQVWLRLRAGSTETGYRDLTTYRYADVTYTPGPAEQAFRRIVVSRRYALRNAAP